VSVCVSVCLSQAGIVWKQLHGLSGFFGFPGLFLQGINGTLPFTYLLSDVITAMCKLNTSFCNFVP